MLISPEEYKMTNWIDEDFNLRKNPIQEEAEKWFEKIKPNTIRSFQSRCNTCGEMKYNGVSSMMDGTFKCNDCIIKDKIQQLCNDPFWVKKDRLFQLRHAREQHRLLAEANKSVEAAISRERKRQEQTSV